MRRAVDTRTAPRPLGPYAQAVWAGDLLFLAGQIGVDPATGRLVEGGAAAEAERALENLAAVVEAAGLGMGDVVKTTVYLADLADGPAVNEVYARRFAAPQPARASIQAGGLPGGARVEIEAIAHRGP